MFKVLIWDYTGESMNWCKKFLDTDVEIVQTITSTEIAKETLLQKDVWDWLLIFERNMRANFDAIISDLKLPLEKIIYALDPTNWVQHPKAVLTLLNDTRGGN